MEAAGWLSAWVVIAVFAALAPVSSAAAQQDGALRIDTVEAFLYHSGSGTFSANILGDTTFHFWNTTIGGGSARRPASQALVRVRLRGSRVGSAAFAVSARFTAAGRTIAERRARVGVLEGGPERYFVAFWIDELRCTPIRITVALLAGNRSVQSLHKKTSPLQCEE